MAGLRPFRGLRYKDVAGTLASLVSPPTVRLTPGAREGFADRNPNNSVRLALPEGHPDDRSKFVRYARAAALMAEWRREGVLGVEERPSFYRLTQRFDNGASVRTALLATADLTPGARPVQAAAPGIREDRLRLFEATRVAVEPVVAFYEDDDHALRTVRSVPVSSTVASEIEGIETVLERVDDPDAMEAIRRVFEGETLLLADGVEGYEAAMLFREGMGTREQRVPEDGFFAALVALDDGPAVRLPVHRVLRSFDGGTEAVLARLSTRFGVEEHHNRNLSLLLESARIEGRPAFGMATSGGIGYLLTPLGDVRGSWSTWLQKEIIEGLLGVSPNAPTLSFTDPIQAVRATDQGAMAAFIVPAPSREELRQTRADGTLLPADSARLFPAIPTGLVFWSLGDEA